MVARLEKLKNLEICNCKAVEEKRAFLLVKLVLKKIYIF
jgi:hypothetical protein